jgi:hypothetical protein
VEASRGRPETSVLTSGRESTGQEDDLTRPACGGMPCAGEDSGGWRRRSLNFRPCAGKLCDGVPCVVSSGGEAHVLAISSPGPSVMMSQNRTLALRRGLQMSGAWV